MTYTLPYTVALIVVWLCGVFLGFAVSRFFYKERTIVAERDKAEAERRLVYYARRSWDETPTVPRK